MALYHYTGFGNAPSVCDIRVTNNVVICTQVPENTGTSITNYAEHLATDIYKQYNINPKQLVWIEHYPAEASSPEVYSRVTFTLKSNGDLINPQWTQF